MKSRRDESSAAAAAAAEAIAAKAMEKAEEAVRKAKMQEEEEDVGPTKFYAIFKAEGFGQLEAMSQVLYVGGLLARHSSFSEKTGALLPVEVRRDVLAAPSCWDCTINIRETRTVCPVTWVFNTNITCRQSSPID